MLEPCTEGLGAVRQVRLAVGETTDSILIPRGIVKAG